MQTMDGMMSRGNEMRDNGIRKAGISCWRYRELKAFCRQYDEKRAQAMRLQGMAGREQESAADEARLHSERLLGDCRLIERTAQEADPGGSEAIIRNAARGVRYEEAGYYGERSSFFRARKRFFVALDRGLREREEHAG